MCGLVNRSVVGMRVSPSVVFAACFAVGEAAGAH